MSSDLDHFAPKDLATAPIEDGSRRHFLAQGGALTGATLAAPTLLGLGAMAAPASAGMAGTGRKTRFDFTSPIWERVSQMMEAAGFKNTAWVDVEWHDTPWSGGGSVEGVVSIGERTKWGTKKGGEYSFKYAYFYNARKKYDIIPHSFALSDTVRQISAPTIPSNIESLVSMNDETALHFFPDIWQQVIRWCRGRRAWGLPVYAVDEKHMGGKWLGCQSSIYTVTQIRDAVTGTKLAVPMLLGTYTVLRGYVGRYWTHVYIPKVTTNMNGLLNSWDAGMVMGIPLATAGVASAVALVNLVGKGTAFASIYTDAPENYGSEFKGIMALVEAAVYLGGSASLVMLSRSYAVMRSRTALIGLLSQFRANIPIAAHQVYLRGDDIPAAGWEPIGSYTPSTPVL